MLDAFSCGTVLEILAKFADNKKTQLYTAGNPKGWLEAKDTLKAHKKDLCIPRCPGDKSWRWHMTDVRDTVSLTEECMKNNHMLDKSKGVCLENGMLRLALLPELGGRMTSLFYKPKNKELLWRTPDRDFRKPNYGDIYEDYDMSGFDECFPTVIACDYPLSPWPGRPVPDHGELWTQSWRCKSDLEKVQLEAEGINFPYKFEKKISLTKNTVIIKYKLTNQSDYNWQYIWAAHPLLCLGHGVRINLPPESCIKVVWPNPDDFEPGKHNWPYVKDKKGNLIDLSQVSSQSQGRAMKLFTERLKEGRVDLIHEKDNLAVRFSFPHDMIPYLGIWINQGKWPPEVSNHFNIALEPTTSPENRLDLAIKDGTAFKIKPKEIKEWDLILEIKDLGGK